MLSKHTCLLLVAIFSCCSIVEITDNTLPSYIANSSFLFTFFYNNDCAGCNEVRIGLEYLSEHMSTSKIAYTQINATNYRYFSEKYTKGRYPTIVLFYNGDENIFDTLKKCSELIEYFNAKIQQHYDTYKSETDLANVNIQNGPALVMYMNNNDDQCKRLLKNLWYSMAYVNIYEYRTTEIPKFSNISQLPTLVLYNLGKKPQIYDGSLADISSVQKFIYEASLIGCGRINNYTREFLQVNGLHTIILFREEESKELDNVLCNYYDVHSYSGHYYVYTDIKTENAGKFVKLFNINKEDLPAIGIVAESTSEPVKYRLANVNKASMVEFMEKHIRDELNPFEISEKNPQQSGPIFKVVGSTFQASIMENENSVVLLCHSDLNLEYIQKTYESVANHYKDIKDITFASIDITKNEMPYVKVSSVPSLLIFRKIDKLPAIEFTQAFDEKSIIRFIDTYIVGVKTMKADL